MWLTLAFPCPPSSFPFQPRVTICHLCTARGRTSLLSNVLWFTPWYTPTHSHTQSPILLVTRTHVRGQTLWFFHCCDSKLRRVAQEDTPQYAPKPTQNSLQLSDSSIGFLSTDTGCHCDPCSCLLCKVWQDISGRCSASAD